MAEENLFRYESVKSKSMAARDAFGVVVRTIGLLIVIFGVYTVLYLVADLAGLISGSHSRLSLLVFSAMYLAAGMALIRGEWVVNVAYGRGE